MTSITSQLTRPISLLAIVTFLAVIAWIIFQSSNKKLEPSQAGTPSNVIVEMVTATPSQPDLSQTTDTPVFAGVLDPAEDNQQDSVNTQTPVPTVTPTTLPNPSPTPFRIREHLIQPGDTLDSIASLYGATAASIAALNYLIEPDSIFPDQTILVPLYPQPTAAPDTVNATLMTALENVGIEPVVLGHSVLDRPIELYAFGSGPKTLIFIGGLHGGYEWNAIALAYEFIDYFTAEPTAVPDALTVHIIPAANPDGIFAVTGKTGPITADDILLEDDDTFPARFNANGVDLNRNWSCDWTPTAVWWDEVIGAGLAPYSEIENKILLAFIESQRSTLQGVVFWHSSAFLVSPGQCGDLAHQPSVDIAAIYAQAARYPVGAFDAYPITGESTNSLAQMGIPSFSVELSSHDAIDWIRNLDGIKALFAHLS